MQSKRAATEQRLQTRSECGHLSSGLVARANEESRVCSEFRSPRHGPYRVAGARSPAAPVPSRSEAWPPPPAQAA